jgi:RNAse (barnase) inhibitor barstar
MMGLGRLQARSDDRDVMFRSFPAFLRFLLETMKNIDSLRETDGVDGAISIPIEIIDHFKDAPASEALEGLGCRVLVSVLRIVDGETRRTSAGNSRKSSLDDPIQTAGFRPSIASPIYSLWTIIRHYPIF